MWWEYIATGTAFLKTEKNYTTQKLAYMAPSQRNIIKRSSFWSKVWSGTPDSYSHTEYGTATVLSLDVDNDGKTDLVSFRKFGKAKYDSEGKLWKTNIENLNTFTYTPPAIHYPDQCRHNVTGALVNSTGSCGFNYTFVPEHWQFFSPVTVNTTTANKIFFHINRTLPDGSQALVNLPNVIDLSETKISPLSLVLANADYEKLNTYKSEVFIHDPVTRSDIRCVVDNQEFSEGLLRQVSNGSPITQVVEYRPMMEKNNTNLEKVYTTDNLSLPYPYYIHKNIGINYLVHKMHTMFDDKVLTVEYRYQNGIQHLWGKGFIGFQKTFVSDAYESRFINGKYLVKDVFKGLYWNVKTHDPLNDNALISSTYGSLNPNSVFTKSTVTNQRFDKGNNRYLILPVLEVNTDNLQGITIAKTYQYDTAGDLLLKQANTDYNSQASSIEKYSYASENTNGDHLFFGKISQVENTAIKNASTFITKEEQDYNPNGTLLQTRKYGNGTPPIVIDYTYTPFGEVVTKTLSTVGVPSTTTAYEYEPTQRYISKITTPDGLVSITNVNALGRTTSEVSGLGLTTSYKYDRWGNVKETTDFLGKKTTIRKLFDSSAPAGSYIIATKREGGVEDRVLMDKFDRPVKTMSQSLNGQWITVSTEYDIFGKKIAVSEPYFSSDTPLWNYIEYDELKRPVKQISFNGKIITTCYEKMKVTVDDGIKKTAKWLDATGKTIRFKDEGGEIFYKYYPNGALKETDYEGIKTKIEIDGWGNKIKLNDPSAGVFQYEYDNLCRLTKEVNPKGGISLYTYDNLGRALTENTTSPSENTTIVKNFAYDPTTKLPTVVSGSYNGRNYTYTTFYNDQYHRVTGKKEETPEFIYETTTTYDDLGRVDTNKFKTTLSSLNYTTQSNIKNNYDANGILISQTDLDNSQVIWTVNNVNSHGLTTQTTYGNGYTVNAIYNNSTLSLEKIKHQKDGIAIVDIDYAFSVQQGVLMNRNNLVFGKSEDYSYDTLNRLLEEKVNGAVVQSYTYDKRGRMTSNTAVGKYNYNEQNYRLESINYNANGSQLNSNRGFVEVQYNSFKNPTEIFLAGKDRISYDYSILKTRSVAYYGSLNTAAANRPNRKFFSADKAIEIIKEGNVTKIITYITGDPYSANYIKIDKLISGNVDSVNRYYLHRDNQNTILAITKADASAAVVEQRYFDAWGNLKNAIVNGVAQAPNALGWVNSLLIDRGYTGHEHLKTVGLIHMNGRLYDPQLKRFLSPDNYVQDPFNTQNYNRFGYVWNNPLLYTDPSGELGFLAVIAIGFAVAITTNAIQNMINGIPFWYGMGKAGVMGAVSGAISFGIGALATDTFGVLTTMGKALFQAGMHGLTGGIMSDLQGGTFASGLAAGAVSSLITSGVEALGQTGNICEGVNMKGQTFQYAELNKFGASPNFKAVMIASGGMSGGLSSAIAGGDFMDGFRQGVITAGLNHLVSNIAIKIEDKSMLVKMLDKAGYKFPNQTAENLNISLEEFARRVFADMYKQAGNPKFTKVDKIESESTKSETGGAGMTVHGKVSYTWTESGGKITTTPTGILIAKDAFASFLLLGEVVGHELNHYVDHVFGCYAGWANSVGGTGEERINYAHNMSEMAAWSWTNAVSPSYINGWQVQRYFNKL
ncbi:MAG: RHS repeat-associated core domain-containing protein [Flavobacterium sp.]